MIGFAVALAWVGVGEPAPVPTDRIKQTAFYCSFFFGPPEGSSEKLAPLKKERKFGFLLSGDWRSVPESAPIEVFDPTGLLEGQQLATFRVANRQKPILALTTNGSLANRKFLGLQPDEGPSFRVALGRLQADSKVFDYYGLCVPATNDNMKAEFQEFIQESKNTNEDRG